MIEHSERESARFGRRIGRLDLSHGAGPTWDVTRFEDFDVVIVRGSAGDLRLPAALVSVPGFDLLPADHLLYWKRTISPEDGAIPDSDDIAVSINATDVIEPLIRDSFQGYQNHYAANPLFRAEDILDGYCEWAAGLVGGSSCSTVVVSSRSGTPLGFGIVDWSAPEPDIRLAGMATAAQGKGLYAHVIRTIIALTARRERGSLVISTQSSNVSVMRAWARLGFLPVRTLTTNHLVRDGLLDGS